LTISVDSLEQKEVNKMRPITDVKKLLKNITWLLQNFPDKIKISMVINKVNLYTFEKTLKKLKDAGLREISFQPYIDFGYPELYLSFKDKKEFLERLRNLKGFGMAFHPSCFNPVSEYCTLPSTAPVVNVTGYLAPCCRINDETVVNMGNLKEKQFKDLFYSKRYSNIQKNISKGKYPSFCKGCTVNHLDTTRMAKTGE
jgi:radical SAM protein with 4Fe4S-binding SPASM domain